MSDLLPWAMLDAESPQAFSSFVVYRDMGADRSLAHASQKQGKSIATLTKWSTKHRWVERARSYDAALDARARLATEHEEIAARRKMLQEHGDEARALRLVAQRLTSEFNRRYDDKGTLQWISGEDFIKMVGQLPKIVETAQKLERLAAGEATERHEHMLTLDQVAGMGIEELEAYMKENNIPL